MKEYHNQFFSQKCSQFSLIIENDCKVCYAYLLFNEKVVGDIWLYNQSETPKATDWSREEDLPFLNSSEFAKDSRETITISMENDIDVDWIFVDNNCQLKKVNIYIKRQLVAILNENSKPGWSINAKKDGPLEKTLNNEGLF